MLVYYTEERESEDKNSSMVSLWFRVAHLTDSPFEAVKVSHGCDGYWETIPLNDCKRIKLVFIIFGPGGYLSVSQWMRGPRSTGE